MKFACHPPSLLHQSKTNPEPKYTRNYRQATRILTDLTGTCCPMIAMAVQQWNTITFVHVKKTFISILTTEIKEQTPSPLLCVGLSPNSRPNDSKGKVSPPLPPSPHMCSLLRFYTDLSRRCLVDWINRLIDRWVRIKQLLVGWIYKEWRD